MKRYSSPNDEQLRQIITRPQNDTSVFVPRVRAIIDRIKEKGDAALFACAREFDGVELTSLRVSEQEIEASAERLSPELKQAIEQAYKNISLFHRAQQQEAVIVETMPGVSCWRKSVAISPIGLYIPGGAAPLFSTALMLGIPAQLAGCSEITVCTPPNRDGSVHPAILYSLALCGIRSVIKAGGAQAIAALAFGTESIKRVEKIFGPGNQYVTMAKQLAAQEGAIIDMPAGPSEVAVLADSSARANFIAADLLSQAEHGADSQVLFVTTSTELLDRVEQELLRQLETLPRRDVAQQALAHSSAVLVESLEAGMRIINQYAPEHLIVMTESAEKWADKVENAGSVFIGDYSPEAVGDYASGPNHTLPTGGYARTLSGVSLDSFVKKITFQNLSAAGLAAIRSTVETMAEAEGLDAHRRAVTIRMEGSKCSN